MKPSKVLGELFRFLEKEDAKKLQAPLDTQPCYVPKFNNFLKGSKQDVVSRKIKDTSESESILHAEYIETKFIGSHNNNNTRRNPGMRKLTYKLENVPVDQDIEAKYEAEEEGYESEERKFLRKTEIYRQKYQCYAINKWRYTVDSDFVGLIEEKCSAMMEMAGYLKTEGDLDVLRDIEHRLVKPKY